MSTILSFDRPVPPADLKQLLTQADWASDRSVDELAAMLEVTPVVLGAWEQDRLVGFLRVLTDGRYRALVDDVIVDKRLRGGGLGSQMMQAVAERLADVDEIFLRCESELVPFYRRLGYRAISTCLDLVDREE